MKFEQDLAIGQEWEEQAANLLNASNPACNFDTVEQGRFPEFDLMCEHCEVTIECKIDFRAEQSGNFAFEENTFQHSIADFILYKAGDDIYLLYREGLREVLHAMLDRQHPDFGIVRGGDGNRQTLYLARIHTLAAMGIAMPFDIRLIGVYQLPEL